MFQSYALFPHMSVEKNVGYGLRAWTAAEASRPSAIQEALEMVQLGAHGASASPTSSPAASASAWHWRAR